MDNFEYNSILLEMAQICLQSVILLAQHDSFYVDDKRYMEEHIYPQMIERLDAGLQYLEEVKIE